MRIFGILPASLVNGDGVRYVIFCQGCFHYCKGCQNPESWSPYGGGELSVEELAKDILAHKHIDGITLSGGDPFFQENACLKLLDILPKDMNIWLYTGFEYKQIKDRELAKRSDVIVDGRYDETKKVEGMMYGSSNQNIIRKGKEL